MHIRGKKGNNMDVKKMNGITLVVRENIGKVIVGGKQVVVLLLVALLAKGHVLLEDVPGTGKTVTAKSLARSLDGSFSRIQFTPDILPSDITGMSVFNQAVGEFHFKQGPVFTNILLADEINRATPRTQSALLECMEERQVTVDGITFPMAKPFMVIATQNPVETQGTFPLPEAQLDRFLIKTSMGYPTTADAVSILDRFVDASPLDDLSPVISTAELTEAQEKLPDIIISVDIRKYIVDIVERTRNAEGVILGVSPRGSLALMRAAQAYAVVQGRDYVLPDDVKQMARPVLAHRIICRSRYGGLNDPGAEVVSRVLSQAPVPTETPEA